MTIEGRSRPGSYGLEEVDLNNRCFTINNNNVTAVNNNNNIIVLNMRNSA